MKNGSLEIHPDLADAQRLAYTPKGMFLSNLVRESESKEYGAYEFEINSHRIKFRVAKITPNKIGQFATLWKRHTEKGPIQPYDLSDPFDLFVISVRNANHFGQFVFPKAVLGERGIVSKGGQGGKRAFRVYPPWDVAENRQATHTQRWQLLYFFEIASDGLLNTEHLLKLFHKNLSDNPVQELQNIL